MKNNNISLLDFLKTYTGISNRFINGYYKFYQICENNKYGIDLDDVIKYLEIKHYLNMILIKKNNYDSIFFRF